MFNSYVKLPEGIASIAYEHVRFHSI
jgi:hypothetical protein